VKKAKFVYVAIAVVSTLLVQPLSTSQATAPTSRVPSLNTQLLGSTSSTFAQLGTGSPLERKSHDGVYYPTRENAGATTLKPWGVGEVTYHTGGTVIAHPNVYVIWYGSWDPNSCNAPSGNSSTASILSDLLRNIGESDWNEINTTYFQKILGVTSYVTTSVGYSGCTVDPGSQGLSLDGYDHTTFNTVGPQISDVVNNSLVNKQLPADPNGVYFVLTSKDVSVADFLTLNCGYHSSFTGPSSAINYAFIGDATNSLRSCAAQVVRSPNNNPAADAMASVVAHELVEMVSDPQGASWYDQAGLENADKCIWIFGAATQTENGSYMNMSFGERSYLIQQNVAANTNKCISALSEKSTKNQSKTEGNTSSSNNG
jgi:hypothetical protein